jgi:hypothetical protein
VAIRSIAATQRKVQALKKTSEISEDEQKDLEDSTRN